MPGPSATLRWEDAASQPPSGDLPILERFDVAVEATGTFRPGSPVAVQVRVTGLTDVTDAELRVALPEVSAAVASEWGDGFRYPSVGEPVAVALRHTFDVQRGLSSEFTVPVQVPAEGYYHVVTSLRTPEDAPIIEGGRWALNTVVDENWLLITETGGELTSTFEPDRIPEGYLQDTGPFRSSRAPVPQSQPDPAGGQSDSYESGPSIEGTAAREAVSNPLLDNITYQIKYYDDHEESYQPLPGAYVVLYLCTFSSPFLHECEDFEPVEWNFTDADGYFSFDCDEDEYILATHTVSPYRFKVHSGNISVQGDISSDCGNSYEDIMPSTKSKLFINFDATVEGAIDKFGEKRSFIDVYEDTQNGLGFSYYDTAEDEIHILTDHVWSISGVFVAGHEYGHAFHEETLLGDEGAGACEVPHFTNTESNLKCAFSEGFATYFAVVTRPDLGSYAQRTLISSNYHFPGCVSREEDEPYECTGGTSYEGSVIEGAFAAFLYDLTDDAIEPHDSIAAAGSYVADLVRSCEVRLSTEWFRANGPDEFAYCAENAINPGSCFTVRTYTANQAAESATEPASWSASRVNSAWRWNMYEKPDSTVLC